MKRILALTSAICLLGLTGAAHAADQMAAGGVDWSGLTLGAIGTVAGGEDYWPGDGTYDLKTSAFGGAFVSYNVQMDQVVAGAEIKAQFGKMKETDYPSFFYNAFYDFNGKLGYAAGNALIFASGGLTLASGEDDGESFTSSGYNIGGGIDFQLTDRVVVGGEYSYRALNDYCPHDLPFELSSHSAAAKVGFRF